MKEYITAVVFLSLTVVFQNTLATDLSLMAGQGIINTKRGDVFQVSASLPKYESIRVHYTDWRRNAAYGLQHDFTWGGWNASPGFSGTAIRESALRHGGAFTLELGYQVRIVRCQITHLSSWGRDKGLNFGLCGVRISL